MSNATVASAVQNSRITSRKGLLQRLFAVWFDAFVYNQIWEDPRVDLAALEIDAESRILTISSGGCNVLNYLLESPRRVTAVDLNRNHIRLLELKLAAAAHLPSYDDFFTFFGRGRGTATDALYRRWIAPTLSRPAREFWESNSLAGTLFYGMRIGYFRDGGLYDHSRNGYFLRMFHRFARTIGCEPEKILDAASPSEQVEIFERHIAPFFDSAVIRLVGKMPVTLFGLGIPPQQYGELRAGLAGGEKLIDVYRQRVRRLACDFPVNENYFAWQAFGRRYDTEGGVALPDYLKPENFEILKSNAARASAIVATATDAVRNAENAAFNKFVFLDAQDWMNAKAITELWTLIAEKGEAGSRVIFRTAGAASPLERSLPSDLLARFRYERELSARLFARDRASIYGGFHLYVLER